ncbi:Ferredoxin (4Fe-4S iron-sulfur cluster binding protein) [Candidatus Sulfotelmatobacter kueseliae]|uniref:Ferredoxin (4Fe-4S iron-sulfur cluster binding protein) n=1 Tax=Candidatus Sulfotelmatobacter kueseliae TaxID=2042962 RepID=A0A2U3K8B1_9BACT|nr:Ferredoxin (4Fe-4S iron-sulfur cluster binding protein) [Candidatus Sulfotelmatobacter kueseliae]
MADETIFKVDLQPVGRRAQVAAGTTLLAAARSVGVELQSICGGAGTCNSCRVRLAKGVISPPTTAEKDELSAEELAAGYRLACQAVALSDVCLDIPAESLTAPQRVQVEGEDRKIVLQPLVSAVDVHIAPPSLTDLRSDLTRLRSVLPSDNGGVELPLPVLASLAEKLRRQEWSTRLVVRHTAGRRQIAGVLPPHSRMFGLAVDIGTTKLAAYLIDLESGETVGRAGAPNPQIAYGEDVISRICFANQTPEGLSLLQNKVVQTMNHLVAELCAGVGSPEQIVDAVVVGNTVMHHIFAGLPVDQLGTAPFASVVSEKLEIPAAHVGLSLSSGATVYLPPNIAGYVGADHVAMLLGIGIDQNQRTVLAIDIGTNTEISLIHHGRILSCSCASGPAFEGAHIRHGMRAAQGAIERVRIIDGKVHTHTIGGVPPVGICGSGILDAVAEMLAANGLDKRGNFRKDSPFICQSGSESGFVLAPAVTTGHGSDIVITRQDVNEIQLAKAAIRAGIEVLLQEAGLEHRCLDEIVIAGAFGSYLDVRSAIRVGMVPPLPRDRFRQVGNAAGTGARQMLLSGERRRMAEEIAQRVEYVELASHRAFSDWFASELHF